MRLTQIIEALLFASDAPLSAADLLRIDERLDEDTVEAVIQELRAEYELSERSFQIYEVAGGYQLLTRPEFVSVLERYDSVPQPARLSMPALEVLAIIAYRQPIGRAEVEDIRGVGSSGVLRSLQERNLIDAVARGEGLGRPLLYGTTGKFLEHFGFRSLEDLPRPDELPVVLRERTAATTDAALTAIVDADAAGADETARSTGNASVSDAGAAVSEGAAPTASGADVAPVEDVAAEAVAGDEAALDDAAVTDVDDVASNENLIEDGADSARDDVAPEPLAEAALLDDVDADDDDEPALSEVGERSPGA